MNNSPSVNHEQEKTTGNDAVLSQLSEIINSYLEANPRVSLNGLSKRCQVSEPTIRRISKKQIKTVPNVSTVLDLLTNISRKKSVKEVVDHYPGPVASYIKEALPHIEEQNPEYSPSVNLQLKDPVRYLIFKLCLNRMGTTLEKVKKIFGEHGAVELQALLQNDIIEEREGRYFSKIKKFTGHFDNFVEQFRMTANFIKPHKISERLPLNPLFVNASESVSAETYKEVAKVQRAAFKKISQLIQNDTEGGPIPLVYLCALDTLDVESASELSQNEGPNRSVE